MQFIYNFEKKMIKIILIKKIIFTLLLCFSNNLFSQVQPWLGIQTSLFNKGFSTGAVIKDKLLLKYSLTSLTDKNEFKISNNLLSTRENIYYSNLISLGWVFTKPYKKLRMGTGLLFLYQVDILNNYENSILVSSGFEKYWFKVPLPFFYLDYKISKKILLVFNTSLLFNELGIGYRFGKELIKPNVESKVKKRKEKEIIFH